MAPEWTQRTDTLGRGQSLVALLAARGVRRDALAGRVGDRRVPAGAAVTVRGRTGDSLPSEVVVELAPDRLLRLNRDGDRWLSDEQQLPWTTDTVVVSGTVRSTLAAAFADAPSDIPRAQRTELAYTVADIFEYRVDMSRDLQPGDRVRVLVERSRGPRGLTKVGRVLAAKLDVGDGSVAAVRYASQTASGDYFDDGGKSLKAHFLRAPLAFRRVSSGFGRRLHPILGVWRQHKGMDYAAASGTPVRAIGDGVVVKAGRGGGYGNVLEIRLRNGYVTRYGHLRNFAKGLRPGSRVAVGQTVAFVGTTGLSTAPHLHFEMLLNGQNRDPRVALRALKGGEPITGRERAAFESVRTRLLASLDPAPSTRALASNAVADED
jgi:murein DD-endopeptidase MepM/ murein hydrolase activator NlpD